MKQAPITSRWWIVAGGGLLFTASLLAVGFSLVWYFATDSTARRQSKSLIDQPESQPPRLITGQVLDTSGEPAVGARVRWKGTEYSTLSDTVGRFTLSIPMLALNEGQPVRLVAALEGHFIGGRDWNGEDEDITLRLVSYPANDHDDYDWIDPRPSEIDENRCANCHPEIYAEWSQSGHARSANNPHFLNVFLGTDAAGRADVGWNLAGDYPEGKSVCLSCHQPSREPSIESDGLLLAEESVHSLGVHCDFCHKVANVSTQHVGLSHGRFAMTLLRPARGEKLLLGPLDDVDRGEDVYSPLYGESRYCASCHEGILFGTHAYSTYSEWLGTNYAERGVQCQDCHMANHRQITNMAAGHGGIERDPATLSSHATPGADLGFLREHLSLEVAAHRESGGIVVRTTVTARDVGHLTPTGHPSRQLLLVLRANTESGQAVPLIAGERLPAAAGTPDRGGQAGQPGKLYAKTLTSLDGDPHIPYWDVTELAADTRLKPDEPDRASFTFAGQQSPVVIQAD
ncbi:MAG: multiheme c-type cytochrome [Pirellulaceae bacterium]